MSQKFHYIQELHHREVERDILDGGCQDVNSREELLQLAEEEGLHNPINWSVWEKTVQQAKADIEALGEMLPVRQTREVWVYTTVTGEFIAKYETAKDAAEQTGQPQGTVNHCAWKKVPLQRANLVFSYFPLTHKEVVTMSQ